MSEQKTPIEGDELGGVIAYINNNQNLVIGVLAGILIIVIAFVGVKQYYIPEQDAEAQKEIFPAQFAFEQDSFKLALEGNAEQAGLLDIIDDYGMTNTANLAHYYAGISYLNLGEYDNAIKHLKEFSTDDMVLGAMAKGAIGDAYVEKGDVSKAVGFYEDAAEFSDNDFSTPMFLFKAALAKEESGDAKGALKDLQTIKDNYPTFQAGNSQVDKHIARIEQKL